MKSRNANSTKALIAHSLHMSIFGLTMIAITIPSVTFAADCSVTSVGATPLNDLGAGTYMGVQGGLYPGGLNSRPAANEAAGVSRARAIGPMDSSGNPDRNGRYALLSIGMSNATQEFQRFISVANADTEIDPALVIVDGAQFDQVASINADPNSGFWSVVSDRLAGAGVTSNQVAVAWVKAANRAETPPDVYRAQLQDDLEEIARVLYNRFPNIKLVYYSSRIYAGYATTALNPEPYAYETGFVVKWVIEKQIGGDTGLNFDPTQGSAVAPWITWGPYLWADGLVARSDGLQWECSDLENDGTHPSSSGEQKVANMLLDFFKTDSTAREWFTADPVVDVIAPAPPEDLMVE